MSHKPKSPPPAHSPRKPRTPRAENIRAITVELLAADQGVPPVDDPQTLRGNFWPEDEGADEFLSWLRDVRREPGKDA